MIRPIVQIATVPSVPQTLEEGLRKQGVRNTICLVPRILPNKTLLYRLGQPYYRSLELLRIRRLLKNHPILHIHYALFGYIGYLNRYPYILHCHGTDVHTNLYRPGLREITRAFLAKASRVFYSTPDLYVHLKSLRPEATFIPNPVNTDRFTPEPAKAEPRSILLISKLDRTKGIDIALESLKLVSQNHPDLSISMMGFGNDPRAPRFRSEASRMGVQIVPRIPYETMPDLIRRHQIIIGQLVSGAIGCSELEAMACGKPVITHFRYAGAYPEAPPLCNAASSKAVATWIERLLTSADLREEIGDQARAWTVKYHGYTAVAARVMEFYET